jgi:hypothetical protein
VLLTEKNHVFDAVIGPFCSMNMEKASSSLVPRIVAAGAHRCVDKSRLGTDLLPGIKSLYEQPTEAQ